MRINRDGSVDLVGTWVKITTTITADEGIILTDFKRVSTALSPNTADNAKKSLALSSLCGNYLADFNSDTLHYYISTAGSNFYFFVPKDFAGNVEGCYPLAEPITYHLPSIDALVSYDGVNNVWHSANGKITVALADADLIEQVTPQPIRLSEGTNTLSWTANVDGKEMSVEYRTSEAPQQVQMLGVNALPNLNLNAPTLQPIGGIGDIQPAVLNPLTIEDEVVNEEPEEEPAEDSEEQI